MLSNNFAFYSIKIAKDIAFDIAFFPLWWYTRGLLQFSSSLKEFMVNRERETALFVWVKNIFVPMYGEYSWEGRLISFFMRVFQIIARGVILVFWAFFTVGLFLAWVLLPPYAVYQILFQIF